MSRKKFFLIAAGAVLLYLVFLFLAFKILSPTKPPTPTSSQIIKGGDSGAKTQELSADRIVNILEKLPYKGTNFTLSYDSSTGGFALNINPGNKSAGNTEFEDYLKQNGVLRSDLDSSGLSISYKPM